MDIHIREKDKQNKTINCIFHFVTPLTNNAVGVPWNQVIQKSKNPEPLMSDNDTTENANISAGSVYELAETVRFSTINLTNDQRIAEVKSAYEARKLDVFTTLGSELDFFGYNINIEV